MKHEIKYQVATSSLRGLDITGIGKKSAHCSMELQQVEISSEFIPGQKIFRNSSLKTTKGTATGLNLNFAY